MISFWHRFDIDWSRPVPEIDAQLYAKYGITKPEQKRIVAKLEEILPRCERLK